MYGGSVNSELSIALKNMICLNILVLKEHISGIGGYEKTISLLPFSCMVNFVILRLKASVFNQELKALNLGVITCFFLFNHAQCWYCCAGGECAQWSLVGWCT